MISRPKARTSLQAAAIALVCALTAACGPENASGRFSRDDIEFGIWSPDAHGEPRFVATQDVPYVEDQAFGWRVRAAEPDEPVKWVERLRLPAAPRSWEGVAESPNITVSADGRSVTTLGEQLPGDRFIGNVWYVAVGDPMGEYQMSVEFHGGQKATFRFRMVMPSDGRSAASTGEVI